MSMQNRPENRPEKKIKLDIPLVFSKRPSWHKTFMDICEIMAKRSTCCKLKTASIIVKDKRIISTGYNGTPSGTEHCDDYFKEKKYSVARAEHMTWCVDHELHAERNAIYYAAQEGIALKNTTLYTLYSPCINCAKGILSCGITQIYYKHKYHKGDSGLKLLRSAGVSCGCLE